MEIVVVGTQRFSGKPERGTLHLSAGFESEDKAEALRLTTMLVDQLNGEIKKLKESTVATWFSVLPIRTRAWRPHHDKGKVLPIRHGASSELKVKFSDFAALASFAEKIGGRVGVTLGNVEWALTEATRTKIEAEVLGRAVQRARERALIMAKAAGASEVDAVEITDPGLMRDVRGGEERTYASFASRSMHERDGEGIEVIPEDVVVTASVNVRFHAR